MDGGIRQKEMAVKIKTQVKNRLVRKQQSGFTPVQEPGAAIAWTEAADCAATSSRRTSNTPDANIAPNGPKADSIFGANSTDRNLGADFWQPSSGPAQVEYKEYAERNREKEKEKHLLMIYLDYVFPYLFPYYRPTILAGGRGWILHVLASNKSVYHTALSLSSFFFAVASNGGDKMHEECTKLMARELSTQVELGLLELHKEVATIHANITEIGREERLMVMQSIIQMLYFEVATSNSGNWVFHLNAAVEVFFQILPHPKDWYELISGLYSTKWPPAEYGLQRPWGASQLTLRFFTSTLFYLDALSSIPLERSPRLVQYHKIIMPCYSMQETELQPMRAVPLSLNEVFGLPNWIVMVISDVAALDCWKRDQKLAASLSVTELVSRGLILSNHVKQGIEVLEKRSTEQEKVNLPSFLDQSSTHDNYQRMSSNYQLIWLLAILGHLNVILSGWQPLNPDIRLSVKSSMELLRQIPAGSCTNALAWPLCISGCLCAPEDEDAFRQIVQRMGNIHMFGGIQKAAEVMEKVWTMRGTIDENWTIGKCFNVLGFNALII